MLDRMSDRMSEEMSDRMLDSMSEHMPNRMPESMAKCQIACQKIGQIDTRRKLMKAFSFQCGISGYNLSHKSYQWTADKQADIYIRVKS